MSTHRPKSLPLFVYYLDTIKALAAFKYANAVREGLEPLDAYDFTRETAAVPRTVNDCLERKADAAFELLAQEDLPAFITHVWMQFVETSIRRRITGSMPAHLRDMSEGLAETFCLTDPSRRENPIIFASQEFHRTTQYGSKYVIGRNCRFLQGPKTNPFSIRRIREKLEAGKEHFETFLNYRRDGSPFMNLLMCTPLMDSRGTVRYFLGAQVDVSGLAKECAGLEYLKHYFESDHESDQDEEKENRTAESQDGKDVEQKGKDEFQELSEMFNLQELDTVRKHGGAMYRPLHDQDQNNASSWPTERLVIASDSDGSGSGDGEGFDRTWGNTDAITSPAASQVPWEQEEVSLPLRSRPSTPADRQLLNKGGHMPGVYKHYLLVRPYPSLRILFASPSLRIPGILQSNLMERIGGSSRVRDRVQQALADGRRVTAKIRWISSPRRNVEYSRPRWIHATPLLGSNGGVGVWMVIIVDEEEEDLAKKSAKHPRKQRRFGLSEPPLEIDTTRETP
ncbi:putative hisactophilin c49s mutant phototropin phy3 fusion protein [Diaporthe ampelina]|uniref:Putative hisactophilin c49s mutant phototropin phy3 fusion protein n=1 Tax=Diaporthe ampelina TaxID=1214573 RepID=A0A0G2FS43_9PEZI|nr:putative hisactophilin c49s mutant phototropin phy3 fusion protein [Diaporthe ampelina]